MFCEWFCLDSEWRKLFFYNVNQKKYKESKVNRIESETRTPVRCSSMILGAFLRCGGYHTRCRKLSKDFKYALLADLAESEGGVNIQKKCANKAVTNIRRVWYCCRIKLKTGRFAQVEEKRKHSHFFCPKYYWSATGSDFSSPLLFLSITWYSEWRENHIVYYSLVSGTSWSWWACETTWTQWIIKPDGNLNTSDSTNQVLLIFQLKSISWGIVGRRIVMGGSSWESRSSSDGDR